MPTTTLYQQGRVFADSPDAAAEKIRDMWGNGRLSILEACPVQGWYEYMIQIGGVDTHANSI